MSSLRFQIMALVPSIKAEDFYSGSKLRLIDRGQGPQIEAWDAVQIGRALPTAEELASVSAQADYLEALDAVHQTRQTLYPRISDEVDSIFKTFKHLRDTVHIDIGSDGSAWVNACQTVKDDNPLPPAP